MFFPLFTLSPSKSLSLFINSSDKEVTKRRASFQEGTEQPQESSPPWALNLSTHLQCCRRTLALVFPCSALLEPGLSHSGSSCCALPYIWPSQYVPGLFCMSLIHLPSINTALRFPHSTHDCFKREWISLLKYSAAFYDSRQHVERVFFFLPFHHCS